MDELELGEDFDADDYADGDVFVLKWDELKGQIYDNFDLLSSQILVLKSELSSTITNMKMSVEDKEYISAKYAYLVKNFGSWKKSQPTSEVLLEEEIGGCQT